jgi:hypothetical protein
MKSRINWSVIPHVTRRNELQKFAAKMRRKGYRIQLNYHGCGRFSIDALKSATPISDEI